MFSSCHIVESPNMLDEINSVPVMQVYLTPDNYSFLLENKMSDVSVPASLFINNDNFKCLMSAQGAGSRLYPKWNYFITLEENKNIYGLNYFNISAQTVDPSFFRTPLTNYIYRQMGFESFYTDYIFMRVNEKQNGLYLLNEKIDESFFAKRSIPVSELIKVTFGAIFTYSTENDIRDHFEKKIPDDNNFNNLADFIYALDTAKPGYYFSSLSKFIDIRQYLRYHALSTVINNSDGLTNNFYLYKTAQQEPYKIIPWDYDKAFDYNINLGLYGDNDIIRALFKNDSCVALYKQEMRNILTGYFTENNLYPVLDNLYNKIKDVYTLDPWLQTNGYDLKTEAALLKKFIAERRSYLLANIDNITK